MKFKPNVIEEAMRRTDCKSADEFGWKFLGKSGTTTRKYRRGEQVPSIETLCTLRKITGIPLDEMVSD